MTITPEVQAELVRWAIPIAGAILAWAWGRIIPILPKHARDWLKGVGGEKRILALIEAAAALSGRTDEERRAWVTERLTAQGVPDSVANLIVEWSYSKFKCTQKRAQ